MNKRLALSALTLIFLIGCSPAANATPSAPPLSAPTQTQPAEPSPSPAPILPSPAPTQTQIPEPSPAPIQPVRISAQNGNLFIRRGPGTAYNRVGVLMDGDSAVAIGRDMLSKWIQIQIPDSEATGWVSLLTQYTKLDGGWENLPAFTFDEWPLPAYIKNCTEHEIMVTPGDLHLYSLWTNEKYLNQVQVDPGIYHFRDLSLPGTSVYKTIDIYEGQTYYIVYNGAGEHHNCPADN